MDPLPFTPRQFVWVWLGMAGLLFAAAAVVRWASGLPFFRPRFRGAEVEQTWVSAASSLGLVAGLFGSSGRANNCMWFTLTSDTLYVGVHFPFNMFMPRFMVGFDLTIPVADVSSVSNTTGRSEDQSVRVAYEITDDALGIVSTAHVLLWPKRGDRFFEILRDKVRAAREQRAN